MRIQEALEAISEGALDTTLNVNEFHGQQKKVAEAVNHIRQGLMSSVNESLKNEKLKADLITNVSHDIKTPLTSIVNYVDLLKRENLENENAKYYIHVLEEKSQRLKQLQKFHQNRYLSMRMGVSFTALLKICILMPQNMHWKIPEYM